MKVSFVLLAHEKPELLKDLLGALLSAGSNVFVHHDATASGDLPAAVAEWGYDQLPGKVYFAKREKVVWGEWSIVQATLNCMESIQQHDTDSDYFMLLSGSCMPVKPVHLLEQYLEQSGKDHIEAVNAEKHTWVTAGLQKQRWSKYHFFNWRYQPFLFETSLKLQRKLKIKRLLPLRHTAHMGSQWWCLRRETIDKVWSLHQSKPILRKFYQRTWVPDELFFQTMVANLVPAAQLSSELMTRYKFNSWGIPRVYYNDDYPELLGESRFFVRKVSHRAQELRRKLASISSMQVTDFSDLLASATTERHALEDKLYLERQVQANRWHSLDASHENAYDFIKSIPNSLVVLIGSDRQAKSQALAEFDKLDQAVVYGDLFDSKEVSAGYPHREGLLGDAEDVALMRHNWHLQLGDIAFNNPGKMVVFSLGSNALHYLEVLRWKAECHIVMVDQQCDREIDRNLRSDLYLKSKVLHLLLSRHCELSRLNVPIVRDLVDTLLLQHQHCTLRAFNLLLYKYQTKVRWPGLLAEDHNHWDFLKSIYSKIIVFVYDDPSRLKDVKAYLDNSVSVPLYQNPFSVISTNDNTLDWHYYLADLAHLNARRHAGVLAIALDRSSIKHLDTLRWKRNLMVVALEEETPDASAVTLSFHVYGAELTNQPPSNQVFHELDALMHERHCEYRILPANDHELIQEARNRHEWLQKAINSFLQFEPLSSRPDSIIKASATSGVQKSFSKGDT